MIRFDRITFFSFIRVIHTYCPFLIILFIFYNIKLYYLDNLLSV